MKNKRNLIALATFLALIPFFGVAQQLNTVSPDQSVRGVTIDVVITGINTNFGQGTSSLDKSVWFQQGTSTAPYILFPNSVNANTKAKLTANMTLDPFMPAGYYDVNVLNGFDGHLIKEDGFNVMFGVGVEERGDEYDVTLFPVPADNDLTVRINLSETHTTQISVYDVSGKKQYFNDLGQLPAGNNSIELPINDKLPSGMYLMQIQLDNKTVTKNFMVK